ncbi:hypothetical protein, partial [Petrachloros mirabilis]
MEPQASVSISDNVIRCQGRWTLPYLVDLQREGVALRWPRAKRVVYDASRITAMDTGGALLLYESIRYFAFMRESVAGLSVNSTVKY